MSLTISTRVCPNSLPCLQKRAQGLPCTSRPSMNPSYPTLLSYLPGSQPHPLPSHPDRKPVRNILSGSPSQTLPTKTLIASTLTQGTSSLGPGVLRHTWGDPSRRARHQEVPVEMLSTTHGNTSAKTRNMPRNCTAANGGTRLRAHAQASVGCRRYERAVWQGRTGAQVGAWGLRARRAEPTGERRRRWVSEEDRRKAACWRGCAGAACRLVGAGGACPAGARMRMGGREAGTAESAL